MLGDVRLSDNSVVWAIGLSVLGCSGNTGDEPPPVGVPAGECAAGEWQRDDGACIAAGLPPDMPCPPAEWLRDDGSCIPAGVPPDGCGQGFVHDGDRGCEPILPSEPCPPGLMAVPGETVCREIAPCGSGTWGDIPVEPDTEYVDASSSGMSDGSALNPWTSIQAAVDAANPGSIVAIAAGIYPEDVVVTNKAVRLWGVCPALVEIVGTAAGFAGVLTFPGAVGTEVRNLAIRGDRIGVGSSGARNIWLERVWVHDTGGPGIEGAYGAAFTLRASLVEHSREVGVFLIGADATVDASLVRDTQLDAQGDFGRGLHARPDTMTGAPSTLRLQGSLVERNHQVGVYVSGSDGTVAESVVRDTEVDAAGAAGIGISVQRTPMTGEPASLLIDRSLVERNHQVGVSVISAEATVDATVVRDTLPIGEGIFGRGVNVQSDATGPATVVVQRSLVEQSQEIGVFVGGSETTVEATVIRDTQWNAELRGGGVIAIQDPTTGAPANLLLQTSLVDRNHVAGVNIISSDATVEACVVRDSELDPLGAGGIGVTARPDFTTGVPATLLLRTSLVERNHELGVFVISSEATLETSVVRATQPNAQGLGGRGLNLDAWEAIPATAVLRALLVEQSHELGVAVVGSVATIESCRVRDTVSSSSSTGFFGDGIIVTSELGPASATIVDTRIEQSARAAIAAHGAHVTVGGSALSCQAFDIDVETYFGVQSQLDNLGDNLCGCPDATETCKAVSGGLEAPPTLEPPPGPT